MSLITDAGNLAADIIFGSQIGKAISITYRQLGNSGFDPITQKPINTNVDTVLDGITDSYSRKEIVDGNGLIKSEDKKLFIRYNDISFLPKLDDKIIFSNGDEFSILNWTNIGDDKIVYELQIGKR